jgi:hypothetical protein
VCCALTFTLGPRQADHGSINAGAASGGRCVTLVDHLGKEFTRSPG